MSLNKKPYRNIAPTKNSNGVGLCPHRPPPTKIQRVLYLHLTTVYINRARRLFTTHYSPSPPTPSAQDLLLQGPNFFQGKSGTQSIYSHSSQMRDLQITFPKLLIPRITNIFEGDPVPTSLFRVSTGASLSRNSG